LEQKNETITILLADPQALVREAVRAVLESQDRIVVVAEAMDGIQAVVEAERTRPNIALLDANLPNRDCLRTTRAIKERVPACRVVVLSDAEDEQTLISAIEAGADGFITKGCPLSELIDAARAVHRGETLVPPRMLGALLQRLIRRRREQDVAIRRVSRLTPRERQVLALLAEGANNDGIAQSLVISPETARTHVQHVLSKLEMHSRLAVAAFVVSNGIMDELAAVDA
jgi:two-component system NarL family response regulator